MVKSLCLCTCTSKLLSFVTTCQLARALRELIGFLRCCASGAGGAWSCWGVYSLPWTFGCSQTEVTAPTGKPCLTWSPSQWSQLARADSFFYDARFFLSGPETRLHLSHLLWHLWGRQLFRFQRRTLMPNWETMNKNGIVTEIHTRIRKDPFATSYELLGKELGRWGFFLFFFNYYSLAELILSHSCSHIRFTLCTCLESLLIEHFQSCIPLRAAAALGTRSAQP